MALSNEDRKDVQNHLGKALAKKVSKVTRDKNYGGIGKERVGKTDDKGWQIETPKKPSNPRFKTSYGYAGGSMYGEQKARPGSGRTQEIADRVKAEHYKTSGQYGHKTISMPRHSDGKLHYSVTDKVAGKTTKKTINRTPPPTDYF